MPLKPPFGTLCARSISTLLAKPVTGDAFDLAHSVTELGEVCCVMQIGCSRSAWSTTVIIMAISGGGMGRTVRATIHTAATCGLFLLMPAMARAAADIRAEPCGVAEPDSYVADLPNRRGTATMDGASFTGIWRRGCLAHGDKRIAVGVARSTCGSDHLAENAQ